VCPLEWGAGWAVTGKLGVASSHIRHYEILFLYDTLLIGNIIVIEDF
jgi:hypothetical protein